MVVPSGTVTFLFTDVVGSTRRWELDPAVMSAELAEHDEVLRSMIAAHGGYVFATGGDGFAAAFADPVRALQAAMEAQAGAVAGADGVAHRDCRGARRQLLRSTLNRAARIMAAGHGGQIVVSDATAALVRDDVPVDGSR